MRKEIEEFFTDRNADDFLLLHVSCHGIKDDEGRLYFAATNTERRLLGSTGVPAQFVSDLMEQTRARSVVLLLDCCYSGAFAAQARGGESIDLKEEFLRRALSGRGRVVLTASNAIEYAWEGDTIRGEGQPSVFTRAVVNGLAAAEASPSPAQEFIYVDDLYRYVRSEVLKAGAKQTPQKWALGVEGELIIAKNSRRIPARGRESHLILLADDDRDITRFVEVNLRLEGFNVAVADDGVAALTQAIALEPDLVVLDIMMPRMDGHQVLTKLRGDSRTAHVPVIILSAKSLPAERTLGLNVGADDYIIKPYDPLELVARVKAVLRRADKAFVLSPTTGLPGKIRIQQQLQGRIDRGTPMSVIHADLDRFWTYNRHYGYRRGDEVIKMTTQVLRRTAHSLAGFNSFVGYIGGDDFVAILPPDKAEEFAQQVIASFDRQVPGLYDSVEAADGFIRVEDLGGLSKRYPLISISLGIASDSHRRFRDHSDILEATSKLLNRAKRRKGSFYVLDRGKAKSRSTSKPT
jgi:diguanylate cyclase (GGDEF)-like protein